MKLTVYHDGQFWVGVIEETVDSKLRAGQVIFGSEPKDTEILDFVNKKLLSYIEKRRFQVEIEKKEKKINPKRLARQVAKEMQQKGVSNYAHEAMQLELQERKKERKIISKEEKEALARKKREMKIAKRKAKHKGR
ncbi:hypothetical protein ADL26_13945 [Thermoactinomyces vulgaris]|jgi:seryl-tRNA(Sec) selenium transferase|nr:hypothetical protein ADL26_13945 [Thermoactinomyces vulgaris]